MINVVKILYNSRNFSKYGGTFVFVADAYLSHATHVQECMPGYGHYGGRTEDTYYIEHLNGPMSTFRPNQGGDPNIQINRTQLRSVPVLDRAPILNSQEEIYEQAMRAFLLVLICFVGVFCVCVSVCMFFACLNASFSCA